MSWAVLVVDAQTKEIAEFISARVSLVQERSMGRENFAAFSVSIDLPSQLDNGPTVHQFSSLLDDMLALFDEFKMPAVWGISVPAASPWTAAIRRRSVAHEIALLGDTSLLSKSRSSIDLELGRRVESAAAVGIRVNAMLLHGAILPVNLEMLTRHRVSLVRSDIRGQLRNKTPYELRPISARLGLWHVPASAVVVGRRSIWPGAEAGLAVRALQEATSIQGFCHFAVDLAKAAEQGVSVIAAVRRVLRAAEAARQRQQLQIAGVSSLATEFLAHRASPTQSVLRRAG